MAIIKSGMVFKGITGAYKRICLFNFKLIVKQEKYPKYIIRAEFYQEMMKLILTILDFVTDAQLTMQLRSENGYGF